MYIINVEWFLGFVDVWKIGLSLGEGMLTQRQTFLTCPCPSPKWQEFKKIDYLCQLIMFHEMIVVKF